MINKAAFARIITDLDLKLSPAMQKNYIDVNWRFVDRALQGQISFGQFLSCYANFLYSYEISQVQMFCQSFILYREHLQVPYVYTLAGNAPPKS